jgi:hypothetical protein
LDLAYQVTVVGAMVSGKVEAMVSGEVEAMVSGEVEAMVRETPLQVLDNKKG